MKWIRYTVDTTPEACDMVSGILIKNGIDNMEIKDSLPVYDEKQGGVFEELQPDITGDLDKCQVLFYVEEGTDASALIESIQMDLEKCRSFFDIGSGKITSDVTDEQDWRDNWKKFFHAFSIEDIRFVPTWEEPDSIDEKKDGCRLLIRIDPGIAFGTGKHESTQLCIRQLRKHIKGNEQVLDLGFGSGILSMVAKKLGAAEVYGTDIDEDCIPSAEENFKNNDLVFPQEHFFIGNLTTDTKLQERVGKNCYDIVVANILADILVDMMPQIPCRLKEGGLFISSGIIDFKADEVRQATIAAGLTVVEETCQGEWVSITARKK